MADTPKSDGGSLDDFVSAATDESVRGALVGGRGLRDFLATIDALTPEESSLLVEEAIKLLEGFYVHLPLKRAMHAVDPLQRLRLLQRRLPQIDSEIAFHHDMTEIFTSVRDLHTNYILPSHFSRMTAFLPFQVEACFVAGRRKYIVSQTVPGFSHETFKRGVELTYWNGIPIDRAVEIAASYHAGSNPAARHARGVAGLTKRAMNISPPPDEEWVVVGYLDSAGQARELRADWTIMELPAEADAAAPAAAASGERAPAGSAFGLDLEGDTFRRINKALFAQHVVKARNELESVRRTARAKTARLESARPAAIEAAATEAAVNAVQGTESTMPDVFQARVVNAGGRNYAYIRIFTFSVGDDVAFVNEFIRLMELPQMPRDGLIVDVRGNGGGLIWAGERLLQLFTPRTIEPCRSQFINTQPNTLLCQNVSWLEPWKASLVRAPETGATFSAGFPITPPELCNDIGQRYYGPVLLITDARCYSTTDIFAAGFRDHKIGPILGTDNNTGAGGANVWTHEQLRNFFAGANVTPPLDQLPKGASMRVAIRRTIRVGDEAGTELEDLGVAPDQEHQLTRDDILGEHHPDLLRRAAEILRTEEVRRFDVTVARNAAKLSFKLATDKVDYVDVTVNGRPRGSRDIAGGAAEFELPVSQEFALPAVPAAIELRGYAGGKLVCYRRLQA